MGQKRRLSRLVSQPLADLYPRLRPATSCRHIALGKHTRTGRQAQRRRQTHRLAHRECERLVARERERERQERQRRSERERDRRSQVTTCDAEDVLRDASWRLEPPIPGCGRSWPLFLRVESLTDVVRERQTVSLARPPPAPVSSDPWRATPGRPGRARAVIQPTRRAVIQPTRLIRHPVCAGHARAESDVAPCKKKFNSNIIWTQSSHRRRPKQSPSSPPCGHRATLPPASAHPSCRPRTLPPAFRRRRRPPWQGTPRSSWLNLDDRSSAHPFLRWPCRPAPPRQHGTHHPSRPPPHPPSPTPPPASVGRRGRKPWQASKPREVS